MIANQTTTMRASGKPAFHAEFGGDVKAGATQPRHLHNGIWAGLASGACMTPLLWTDLGSFPLLTDPTVGAAMSQQYLRLAEVVRQWPEVAQGASTAAAISTATGMRAWGMRMGAANAERGFAWVQVQAPTGSIDTAPVSIAGLTPGAMYRVDWYDTWTSGAAPISVADIADLSGVLTVTAPNVIAADVAMHFEYVAAPSAIARR